MKLSMIWAMDKNNLIGKGSELPWHLPADLDYFRRTTSGKPVIMGLTTHHSIGKALPKRRNIVMSFNQIELPGCEVATSKEKALASVEKEDEAFIIGGRSIYRLFLDDVDRLYVTRIEYEFKGDIYFPEVNWDEWKLIKKEKGPKNEKNPYDYYFCIYERK